MATRIPDVAAFSDRPGPGGQPSGEAPPSGRSLAGRRALLAAVAVLVLVVVLALAAATHTVINPSCERGDPPQVRTGTRTCQP